MADQLGDRQSASGGWGGQSGHRRYRPWRRSSRPPPEPADWLQWIWGEGEEGGLWGEACQSAVFILIRDARRARLCQERTPGSRAAAALTLQLSGCGGGGALKGLKTWLEYHNSALLHAREPFGTMTLGFLFFSTP